MAVLYPKNFEQKVGFDKVREKINAHCISDMGREKCDQIKFSTSARFIQRLIGQVEEFKEIIEMEENFPLDHCINLKDGLEKIRIEGRYMEQEEVHALRLNLSTIRQITGFLKKRNGEEDKYPGLYHLSKRVKVYPYISERIDQILTNKGEIKDSASQELKRLRREIGEKESSVSGRIDHIFKDLKEKGIAAEDSSLAIREGRTVIPLDARHKRKIQGVIQDESASGKTVYIEPREIVEINNQLKELRYEVRREIIRILTAFADDIRPYLDELQQAIDFLGTIDFIRAKALFARDIEAIKPAVVNQPHIRWHRAVHPLLYLNLKKENRQVVPLDVALDPDQQRILVISGPNAGGKSVCLTTTGLIQYMFQCGLLVPLKHGSEMGIFKNLFINIGDDQSIENDLSTYSSHLVNMKNFIRYADDHSLVLIDEFGAGTEPVLGGAIAEAILDRLNQKQVMGLITTHYANLKHFASSTRGIENGAMLFDTDKMSPLYQLTIGEPGSSFAFEIAKKIGLPADVLQQASSKVGQQHINFDKNLKDIIRDKRYWEKKRESIKEKEKKLEKTLDQYSRELASAEQQKKQIKQEAEQQARAMLDEANKKIENTIRQIKESQADKQKTREARKAFENFKTRAFQQKENAHHDPKQADIRQQKQKLAKERTRESRPTNNTNHKAEGANQARPFQQGDKVRLKGRDAVGEVMDINDKSILVAFGNMMTTIEKNRLERIDEQEYQKQEKSTSNGLSGQSFNLSQRRMEFRPELDIRGKRADEALQMVRDFIDEAIMVNTSRVRILHGKGTGALRQLVRDYLGTVQVVKSFRDEHVEYGGAGITVVEFDQ